MLLALVQSFLRATVSNEFTEVSITSIHACTIWIFHMSVIDCTFIAPTEGLYLYTLYTSSFILIRYLI